MPIRGRLRMTGSPAAVRADPQLVAAYLDEQMEWVCKLNPPPKRRNQWAAIGATTRSKVIVLPLPSVAEKY